MKLSNILIIFTAACSPDVNDLPCLTLQDTLTFELVGSESAMQVFYINPTTGLVSLKKSLAETVDETFTVS